MRIALVTSTVPFVRGGARNIVDWLAAALRDAGHEVETIALPFDEDPTRIVGEMARFRMIDLTDQADRVVCFRPPSYLVQHPYKILWFIHHIRPYYDLWDTHYRGFADTAITRARRDLIRRVDDRAFAEARHIFTNSTVVADRLDHFNGIEGEVLYPPLPDVKAPEDHRLGDEIVAVSRLEHHKRQHLLVEALGHTTTGVRLHLVGKGSSPDYAEHLRDLAESLGVRGRLTVDDAWVEEDAKQRIIARSLATAYIPLDEDSYGYPTLESARSRRGVLTTSDAGGVLELVEDDRSGLVSEPTPESLANAMDRLFTDRDLARRLGAGAADRVDELGISWSHVVERIVSA
ncbi:glycosyltransferase family 4 protein [Frondihabitans australicus]|uniref:Glycosyltransferase involved in cell wall biosynthesis n=1 Tax=Frondihabitans australicus TaxID=386892 RepID=A0A495II36_9MICO|nr:glycosyltransferase family 4 protein [Frondihabitans australicus]RKR75647.1 glycosyltransferase involved in cell wall biosynthesis [Frondihabitans australicus]